MTDAAYTHITVLADRTGSMALVADRTSGKTKAELTTTGIKDLIRDQDAQPGKTTFSLCQFDTYTQDGVEHVTWFAPGSDHKHENWRIDPRGGTPLLDATWQLIRQTGEHLSSMPEHERPGRVIFVIGTDGEENSSRMVTKQEVADVITRQRDVYRWDFVFIGADIDAFAEAGGIGIHHYQTVSTSGPAMAAAFHSTSDAISRSRKSGKPVAYTDKERDEASGKKAGS